MAQAVDIEFYSGPRDGEVIRLHQDSIERMLRDKIREPGYTVDDKGKRITVAGGFYRLAKDVSKNYCFLWIKGEV